MCADIIVLSEKLRCPPARGLTRERLVGPLVDESGPATALVVGLAGAGKTTLLAHAADRLGASAGWYRTTATDHTAAAMVAHLRSALRIESDPASPVRDIESLLAATDQIAAPCAVILDDLHEIRGTEAEAVLEQFLELRPSRLRVLLGSRSPPQLNLPRLRVSGRITEVGIEELRFRSWEVEQLLAEVYGTPLPPEAAAALTRKTGGWAAGLQLFHLATSAKGIIERCQAVRDLDGRSHLIRSYLARNVLAEMSTEKREFLVRTSTLGLLTAGLCDALLHRTRSGQLLAELEEDQVFTSSDDDGLSYRYHHVLQMHLEAALVEDMGPQDARNAYARSAELLEARGAARDALRAFAMAEDWQSVARLLRETASDAVAQAGSWEDLIPRELRHDDPWFALAEARRQARRGRVALAVATYRRAESLLAEPAFLEQCQAERSLLTAWLDEAPPPGGRPEQPGVWHWSLRLRAATHRIPRETVAASTADPPVDLLGDGLCALLAGDLGSARTTLVDVIDASLPGSLERSVAMLAHVVTGVLTSNVATLADELEGVHRAAATGGHEWLVELTEVLQRALGLASAWSSKDVTRVMRLQPRIPDADDGWWATANALILGVARELAGLDAGPELDAAAAGFDGLDAPVLAVWTQSFAAVGAAWRSSLTDERLTGVEARARRLGGAGPLALVAVARALTSPSEHRVERTVRAATLADECGLPGELLLRIHCLEPVPVAQPAGVTASRASGSDPRISLVCFGGFRLQVGESVVDLTAARARARALLRLLAVSVGHELHRELLIEALWPGVSLASATRSLQVGVSSLRRILEANGLPGLRILCRRGDAYGLRLPDGGRADVRDLPAGLRDAGVAAARGDLAAAVELRRRALDLYTGDLLPEDGPAEWVVAERERLRLVAAGGALDQAMDLSRLGDLSGAIAAASDSVRIHRFSDAAWDVLVRLHDEAGNAAEAVRARRDHAAVVAYLLEGVERPIGPVRSRRSPRPRDGERARA